MYHEFQVISKLIKTCYCQKQSSEVFWKTDALEIWQYLQENFCVGVFLTTASVLLTRQRLWWFFWRGSERDYFQWNRKISTVFTPTSLLVLSERWVDVEVNISCNLFSESYCLSTSRNASIFCHYFLISSKQKNRLITFWETSFICNILLKRNPFLFNVPIPYLPWYVMEYYSTPTKISPTKTVTLQFLNYLTPQSSKFLPLSSKGKKTQRSKANAQISYLT